MIGWKTIRNIYVLLHMLNDMEKSRVQYVYFCCINTNWDTTTTEQMDFCLFYPLYA